MDAKSKAAEAKRVLLSAMRYLETTYGRDVDVRPWMSNDHPMSQAHWILAQHRFRVMSLQRSSRADDPEILDRTIRGFTSTQTQSRGEIPSSIFSPALQGLWNGHYKTVANPMGHCTVLRRRTFFFGGKR